MCGIAGVLGLDEMRARPAAERMQQALVHRGPDDRGLEVVRTANHAAPAVLAHTRLSIVELTAEGHQPMWDRPSDGVPNVVVFNGEIYNFRQLNGELARAGWPCRTGSDTETLLHAYRVFGTDAVQQFDGMFAFCLIDGARGLAWLCRDRIGIKPLYLYRPVSGGLLFASEVRGLLAAGPELVPRRLRRPAIESFLAQGAVMSEDAMVEGVKLLAPGTSLVCDLDGRPVSERRYWAVAFGSESGTTDPAHPGAGADTRAPRWAARFRSELVADLGQSLRRSVASLLLADVPLGLFLSSGVDSSAIAAIAREVSPKPLHTLAVGFDVAEFDESRDAELIARELGTEHQRIELSGEEVLQSFDTVLSAVDQPTVDGFNTFFISRAARRAGLTVALSGVGGDELFGGYRSFTDVPRALRLRGALDGLGGSAATLTADLFGRAAQRYGHHKFGRALLKVAETAKRPADLVELYLLRRELFTPASRRSLHPLPSDSEALSGLERTVVAELRDAHAGRDPLDSVAALEFEVYMRHMLLRDSDAFGMANQLEIRVPLLEHYVVADAARARAAWRQRDPRPKPLLVDAAGARLPERTYRAKKRGFTFPFRAWLEGPLAARAAQGIHEGPWRDAGIDPRGVSDTWRAFERGDRRVSETQIIALLVLESYLRQHRLHA